MQNFSNSVNATAEHSAMPTPSEAPGGERVEARREGRKARQSPDHEPETGGESRGGTHNPLVAGSSPARPTTHIDVTPLPLWIPAKDARTRGYCRNSRSAQFCRNSLTRGVLDSNLRSVCECQLILRRRRRLAVDVMRGRVDCRLSPPRAAKARLPVASRGD